MFIETNQIGDVMDNLDLINKQNDVNSLIDTLVKARKKKNMTQKELADKIGVSVYQIRKLESRYGSVTLDIVISAAVALDLQLTAFKQM